MSFEGKEINYLLLQNERAFMNTFIIVCCWYLVIRSSPFFFSFFNGIVEMLLVWNTVVLHSSFCGCFNVNCAVHMVEWHQLKAFRIGRVYLVSWRDLVFLCPGLNESGVNNIHCFSEQASAKLDHQFRWWNRTDILEAGIFPQRDNTFHKKLIA